MKTANHSSNSHDVRRTESNAIKSDGFKSYPSQGWFALYCIVLAMKQYCFICLFILFALDFLPHSTVHYNRTANQVLKICDSIFIS